MSLFHLLTLLTDFHKTFNERCAFSGYPTSELPVPYSNAGAGTCEAEDARVAQCSYRLGRSCSNPGIRSLLRLIFLEYTVRDLRMSQYWRLDFYVATKFRKFFAPLRIGSYNNNMDAYKSLLFCYNLWNNRAGHVKLWRAIEHKCIYTMYMK